MARKNVSLTTAQIQVALSDFNHFMGNYKAFSTTTKELIRELYNSLTPEELEEFNTEICPNQHGVFLEIVGKKKRKGQK